MILWHWPTQTVYANLFPLQFPVRPTAKALQWRILDGAQFYIMVAETEREMNKSMASQQVNIWSWPFEYCTFVNALCLQIWIHSPLVLVLKKHSVPQWPTGTQYSSVHQMPNGPVITLHVTPPLLSISAFLYLSFPSRDRSHWWSVRLESGRRRDNLENGQRKGCFVSVWGRRLPEVKEETGWTEKNAARSITITNCERVWRRATVPNWKSLDCYYVIHHIRPLKIDI